MAVRSSARLVLAAEAALFVSSAVWGANIVLVKFALVEVPPLCYQGLRCLVCAVLLAPWGFKRIGTIDRSGWLIGAGVGVSLFAGWAFQAVGLKATSPGIAGFLTGLYVVIVPVLVALYRRRWPSGRLAMGVIVVVGGLALLSSTHEFVFGYGESLCLLSGISWAIYMLGLNHGAARTRILFLATIQMVVCAALSLLTSVVIERPSIALSPAAWGALAVAGLTSAAAMVLTTFGQRHTSATLASVISSLQAVFALAISLAVGYDRLTLHSVLGFVLMFAGTLIARLKPEPAPGFATVRRAQ